jgi:hypothetical protein
MDNLNDIFNEEGSSQTPQNAQNTRPRQPDQKDYSAVQYIYPDQNSDPLDYKSAQQLFRDDEEIRVSKSDSDVAESVDDLLEDFREEDERLPKGCKKGGLYSYVQKEASIYSIMTDLFKDILAFFFLTPEELVEAKKKATTTLRSSYKRFRNILVAWFVAFSATIALVLLTVFFWGPFWFVLLFMYPPIAWSFWRNIKGGIQTVKNGYVNAYMKTLKLTLVEALASVGAFAFIATVVVLVYKRMRLWRKCKKSKDESLHYSEDQFLWITGVVFDASIAFVSGAAMFTTANDVYRIVKFITKRDYWMIARLIQRLIHLWNASRRAWKDSKNAIKFEPDDMSNDIFGIPILVGTKDMVELEMKKKYSVPFNSGFKVEDYGDINTLSFIERLKYVWTNLEPEQKMLVVIIMATWIVLFLLSIAYMTRWYKTFKDYAIPVKEHKILMITDRKESIDTSEESVENHETPAGDKKPEDEKTETTEETIQSDDTKTDEVSKESVKPEIVVTVTKSKTESKKARRKSQRSVSKEKLYEMYPDLQKIDQATFKKALVRMGIIEKDDGTFTWKTDQEESQDQLCFVDDCKRPANLKRVFCSKHFDYKGAKAKKSKVQSGKEAITVKKEKSKDVKESIQPGSNSLRLKFVNDRTATIECNNQKLFTCSRIVDKVCSAYHGFTKVKDWKKQAWTVNHNGVKTNINTESVKQVPGKDLCVFPAPQGMKKFDVDDCAGLEEVPVWCISYINGEMQCSGGHATLKDKNALGYHTCSTVKGSSGGIVVRQDNHKAIGVHIQRGETDIDPNVFQSIVGDDRQWLAPGHLN